MSAVPGPLHSDLSIVIVSWNTRDVLMCCLEAIESTIALADGARPSYEVIVVDNVSSDGTPDAVRQRFPSCTVIETGANLGFAKGCNIGIRASSGSYVLLLNSDALVRPGTISTLANLLTSGKDVGACAARLVMPDGNAQPYAYGGDPTIRYLLRRAIVRIVRRGYLHDWNVARPIIVDWVSGCCLMVRRDVLDAVGGLDERFFMYFEDNDLCLRIRNAGWKIVYEPRAEVLHLGGQSLAKNPAAPKAYYDSLRYFYRKHYGSGYRLALSLLLPLYRRLG